MSDRERTRAGTPLTPEQQKSVDEYVAEMEKNIQELTEKHRRQSARRYPYFNED